MKTLEKTRYCRCCRNTNYKVSVKLSNFSIVKCSECGLTFVITEKSSYYSEEDYFDGYDLEGYTEYYKDFRNSLCRNHLSAIEQIVPKGKILDIGCSFGWFLKIAKDSGWQPFGIEHSEKVAKLARDSYGIDVRSGDINLVSGFDTKFQVITLWNVLEHTTEPVFLLRALYDRLSPEGLLVISVPDINGLFSKTAFLLYKASMGKFKFAINELYQSNNRYMHLFHFSEDTLGLILKQANFKVIKVVKQQVIDIKKIRNRICMDKKLKVKSNFSKLGLTIGAKLLFYLSEITNLQDELVIYAKKSPGASDD